MDASPNANERTEEQSNPPPVLDLVGPSPEQVEEVFTFDEDAPKRIYRNLAGYLSIRDRKLYFGGVSNECRTRSEKIIRFLLESAKPGPLRSHLEEKKAVMGKKRRRISNDDYTAASKKLLELERTVWVAHRLYSDMFPTEIWNCCKGCCFATTIIDPSKSEALLRLRTIYNLAQKLHDDIENDEIERRRKGEGGSNIAFYSETRKEREEQDGQVGTDRQHRAKQLWDFVGHHCPFLRGQGPVSDYSSSSRKIQLCTKAITLLLTVSRSFLYHRKKISVRNTEGIVSHALRSLVDTVGLRARQHRRTGSRKGFPSIQEMTSFECGCPEPCFSGTPDWRLERLFKDFSTLAKSLKPRRKEHQFLLNILFCPLTNSTVKQCSLSIATLFTVSKDLVDSIRLTLDKMCSDPELQDRPLRDDWEKQGYTYRSHPILRYDANFRGRIENLLDMVLRYDPAGGDGETVCRVYSLEVNTHEKLRELISSTMRAEDRALTSARSEMSSQRDVNLQEDLNVDEDEFRISSSTLQRIINNYLRTRNLRIVFQQTDHNACPNCKAMQYSAAQCHYEYKQLKMKHSAILLDNRNAAESDCLQKKQELSDIERFMNEKKEQEEFILESIRAHCKRDCRIRAFIKVISDRFRDVENDCIRNRRFDDSRVKWNVHAQHAMITHQDDMTKVDLPYFVQSASADITRWRFDVNAHVNAVNGDAVVFSHEQGSGSKNSSCIIEEIILDHLIRCRGEGIKVIVSDNASVGKNWLSTIALPQYLVDQGLANVVLVVFLENNHGKWLADQLFGQLQTRRKRSTLLGIDDLLKEFQMINRTRGKVRGFALNPLSSVDFVTVLDSLGYQTKPPKNFHFTRRNIHFAGACRPGAKAELGKDLLDVMGDAFPEDPGMVRISTDPPEGKKQDELLFHERYFDVPACKLSEGTTQASTVPAPQPIAASLQREATIPDDFAPLVVPLDKEFSLAGNGVVSSRTAKHVGHNGYKFRNLPAFPELLNLSSDIVRRAWPPGLLDRALTRRKDNDKTEMEAPKLIPGTESVKCAPENWVVREPVFHFDCPRTGPKARYPPRNLLNAWYEKGPRCKEPWIPTATYREPPFPVREGTAACRAMKEYAVRNSDISEHIHVLHVLRAVYKDMGRAESEGDAWLQRRATIPAERAVARFKEQTQLFFEREEKYPTPAITVKQSFRRDPETVAAVDRIMLERGLSPTNAKQKTKIANELFEKAMKTPGALNRHQYNVQMDLKRVAIELKPYRLHQKEFDAQKGLTPIVRDDSSGQTTADCNTET